MIALYLTTLLLLGVGLAGLYIGCRWLGEWWSYLAGGLGVLTVLVAVVRFTVGIVP